MPQITLDPSQPAPQPVTPPATEGVTEIAPIVAPGLSEEELSDPNKIKVTINDPDSPVIVLFGSPACGKTMTLVRLTRYLKELGYRVEPDGAFRPHYDENYRNLCDNFNSMVNSDDAAASTSNIAFMLVKVIDPQGKTICQLLEAPGEGYFRPEQPKTQFPAYINNIINGKNRKVWVIMVEPNTTNPRMSSAEVRCDYVDKIKGLKTRLRPRDKVIFVYNKIDQTQFVVSPGVVNFREAKKDVCNNYPNIFVPFTNTNPITKLWRPFNFDFLAFHTGDYNETTFGTLTYTQGPDAYPKKLWHFLSRSI